MPLAFGLPSAELNAAQFKAGLLGDKDSSSSKARRPMSLAERVNRDYAYLFEWDELYAPRALYELQKAGVLVKVATNTFEITWNGSSANLIMERSLIPVKSQTIAAEKLFAIVKEMAEKNWIRCIRITKRVM